MAGKRVQTVVDEDTYMCLVSKKVASGLNLQEIITNVLRDWAAGYRNSEQQTQQK